MKNRFGLFLSTNLIKWITFGFIIIGINAIEQLVTQQSPSQSNQTSSQDSTSTPSKPTNQRLFLLLVDGMPYRIATNSQMMPNLVRLQKQSATAKVTTTFEAYSSSAIRAAFSGTSQNSIFDVINNFKHDNALHINSIFTDLKKDSIAVSIYSDGHFNQFGNVFTNKYHRYENEYYTDTDKRIPLEAFTYFKTSSTPFVIAHYETTDWAGHEFGTVVPEYIKTYQHIDSLIGEFAHNLADNEHLIIVGDHGMNEQGEHKTGMDIPTYLSITGNLVYAGTDLGTIPITQVKDIIALVFNTPLNPYQSPIKNLLPAFRVNPDSLHIQNTPLHFAQSPSLIQVVVLVLLLFSAAIYGISFSAKPLDALTFIPLLLLFFGVLATTLSIQISLFLAAILFFLYINKKTVPFQFPYSVFIVSLLTALISFFAQKLGLVKTSPAAFLLIFVLLFMLFQKQWKIKLKTRLLLFIGVLILLFISIPYRPSLSSIQHFAPNGMLEIILIYAIGILSKSLIYFRDVRSLKAGIFPLLGLIISLLPELQAVNATQFSEQAYFIIFACLCALGFILTKSSTDYAEIRKSSLLTLLFLLLYHTYQIPIYHYFFFDISIATLYLMFHYLKPDLSKKNQTFLSSSILLSAILLSSATLVNATTNGIEWKFLYNWFNAVYVEKNIWVFFPIILTKFLIPILIIKHVFKNYLNQEIISYTNKNGSLLFMLILILSVFDYGISADKIFFNTTIELFLTNFISFIFLF